MNRSTALAAALALALSSCARKDHDDDERPRSAAEEAREKSAQAGVVDVDEAMWKDLGITTSPVVARAAGEGARARGELRVNEDAYAEVSAPLPARVERALAAPGDVVKAGQGLLELDSFELGRARAELLSARARRDLAEKAAARKRQLANEHVVAEREALEAEAEATQAALAEKAARATLRSFGVSNAEIDATTEADGRLVVRAPVAGTVLERDVLRGAQVEPGRTLFKIADEKTLWLVVRAPEADAVRVTPGAVARVTFPALPGRSFTGKVTQVGRAVDVASRTIPVRIDLPNDDGALRTGMSADAWLPVGATGDGSAGAVVVVPSIAMQRTPRGWSVFVPVKEGPANEHRFEVRAVMRGKDLGGEVEVLSGLKAGEDVVVNGAFLLKAEAEKALGLMGEEE